MPFTIAILILTKRGEPGRIRTFDRLLRREVLHLTDQRPNITYFIISLKDSSGFEISEIVVDSWIRNIDTAGKINGYSEDNKIEFDDFKEYQRINTFEVAVSYLD